MTACGTESHCMRKVRTPQKSVAGNARLREAFEPCGRIRATETNAGQCRLR